MEITGHLSETEIAEFVANPARGLGTHLGVCDACLHEVARLREAVTALRSSAVEPEAFWRTQQAEIRARLPLIRPVRSAPSMAWAALAAAIALAGFLLSGGPTAPAPEVSVDPDHELLIEVERVMQSDGPVALQPASYLVGEISHEAKLQQNSRVRHKEISHEN
jgi:hypothetical protein